MCSILLPRLQVVFEMRQSVERQPSAKADFSSRLNDTRALLHSAHAVDGFVATRMYKH